MGLEHREMNLASIPSVGHEIEPTVNTSVGQATIVELARQIEAHRARYYAGTPTVSDEAYDALEDRLRQLDPKHPLLAEVGTKDALSESDAKPERPTPKPKRSSKEEESQEALFRANEALYAGKGDESAYAELWQRLSEADPENPVLSQVVPPRGQDWPKADHRMAMGSLNKANSQEELRQWLDRCQSLLNASLEPPNPSDPGSIVELLATEKLDGLSVELVYENGRLVSAITRGDGFAGERITSNCRHMRGVPAKITATSAISVRGEIILKKSDQDAVETFRASMASKTVGVKNLRNTAAGLARARDPDLLSACTYLSVVAYDLLGHGNPECELAKLNLLNKLGFETPPAITGSIETIEEHFAHYQQTHRSQLDYEIDGLVIRINNLEMAEQLGELNRRPRGAIALKFEHESRVTRLEDIVWSTGDTGRITPIAQIEPVELAGATIRQSSLHNLARVLELGIAPGDEVLVSRRNDVIPYIEEVVVSGGGTPSIPTHCPSCQTPIQTVGEYLTCPNVDCRARRVGRMKTWIRQIGLMEWGEKTIERLYDEGLACEPADLYRLNIEDIAGLEGFGEVSARKLLNPLFAKKQLPLPIFIAALGIESVSRQTANWLSEAHTSLDEIVKLTDEELAQIPGLGPLKAERIRAGLAARSDEIARLRAVGVTPALAPTGGALHGLSFCFSGSHSRPRAVLTAWVEEHGGTVVGSISKKLSYLILADSNSRSSKAQKARSLGVTILDEPGLEALIRDSSAERPVELGMVEANHLTVVPG